MFAIGAGDQVVGVTHECDYPAAASKLPKLTSSALPDAGSAGEIDRHVRRSLHAGSSLYHLAADVLEDLAPDLIITQELCKVCAVSYEIVDRAARRLSTDPRIISLEPSSLEDVFSNINTVAALCGREQGALTLLEKLRRRVAELRRKTSKLSTRRTLVLEWTDPPMSAGHWTPGLIELAGGTPVLGNPGANSVTLTHEQIDEADPQIAIVAPCGFSITRIYETFDPGELDIADIFLVDGNAYVNRPGPRLVDTAEIFAACIHDRPELTTAGALVYGPYDAPAVLRGALLRKIDEARNSRDGARLMELQLALADPMGLVSAWAHVDEYRLEAQTLREKLSGIKDEFEAYMTVQSVFMQSFETAIEEETAKRIASDALHNQLLDNGQQ